MARLKQEVSIFMFRFSLQLLALLFLFSRKLRREIYNEKTGFVFNARYQFTTFDNTFNVFVIFDNGRMRTGSGRIDDPDVTIRYRDRATLARIYSKSPEESLDSLLSNEMNYSGKMAYLTRFAYLTTVIKGSKKRPPSGNNEHPAAVAETGARGRQRKIRNETLDRKIDEVRHLDDPYLGRLSIEDFPDLNYLRDRRFTLKPAVCIERARLLTEYHRRNGFETDPSGNAIDPVLRQAGAINHILSNRKPVILNRHLLAGSTTSKEVGVPVYPELIGTTLWPELHTIGDRELNPNDLAPSDADVLNFEVFPYWMERNVREYCRKTFGNPLSQQLEERFVLYFMMKNNAISHTIPDFRKVLSEGLNRIRDEAMEKEKTADTDEQKNFYKAVGLVIDGVLAYARHLGEEALRIAAELDPEKPDQARRIAELQEMARICNKAPAEPAATLHEALMSIWISFTCLHAENANSALSIGRLDQLLQPFFLKDMASAQTPEEKDRVIRRSVELVGHFCIKCNDHDPLIPNVGNKLFGGSSSDDTVTIGGVDREGRNAVCDMTFIILKAIEMLGFQDPNLNTRYHAGVNSKEYLRRLCETNINTVSSPSIHNDRAMIEALVHQGIPIEDARDWGATGCVEPTICGRHYGHTNCMLLNMVAPLEMALNNGLHPVINEQIGPETGDPRTAFQTYGQVLSAYKTQLKFLIDQSVEINNFLGRAHQYIHPTPLLSAMFTGPMEKGRDIIFGGAAYNSSGVALVSITDVVDSLMAIRNLIFEDKTVNFPELLRALENDFEGEEGARILRRIRRTPKFGSGDHESVAVAQDLMDFVYDAYQVHTNYRGGKYLPGYWSISYHVGFGMLSGALPSGRRKGKAFTPGLTPAPGSSDQVLDNIHAVAALDHLKMPNNIAFNVKMTPHAGDSHGKTLDHFTSYVRSYFDEGGMQWQFNVVTTETMKAALEHPEEYGWLVVRISGYNAYFVKLNRNMQQELIERTEFDA